jgi:glycosyltransferase involved in cell wall biosynthesis
MKIVYITVKTPFCLPPAEAFILPEVVALLEQGIDVSIFPIMPRSIISDSFNKQFEQVSIPIPVLDLRILLYALRAITRHPSRCTKAVLRALRSSRNAKILFKNLTIVPRALAASFVFEQMGIDHIHAHWGSRTSTLAIIASEIIQVSWSFTLHRWDIYENNLLLLKCRSASFTRCISVHGKKEVKRIVGELDENRIKVIHMGVDLPATTTLHKPAPIEEGAPFIIAVPALLLPVKGHQYLIDAIAIIVEKGLNSVQCMFYGDGPLRESLVAQIGARNLNQHIFLEGRKSHDFILNLYRMRQVDAVCLPSINDAEGNHEGVPVSLMEAMAYQIPVVSTDTGGIPEILGDGEGLMVEEKNPIQLANALISLMTDRKLYVDLSVKGRRKIEKDFDVRKNVAMIASLMK